MQSKNNWKPYNEDVEVDTDDSTFKKFMVRLTDGRELVACYSFVSFIDLVKGEVINDEDVVEYRELEDGEHV